jgi:hypothetical protein
MTNNKEVMVTGNLYENEDRNFNWIMKNIDTITFIADIWYLITSQPQPPPPHMQAIFTDYAKRSTT